MEQGGMRPYKKLLLAVLAAVVLAQVAAMALLAQSQVEKAQARDAAERIQRMATVAPSDGVSPKSSRSLKDGVINVGYVAAR